MRQVYWPVCVGVEERAAGRGSCSRRRSGCTRLGACASSASVSWLEHVGLDEAPDLAAHLDRHETRYRPCTAPLETETTSVILADRPGGASRRLHGCRRRPGPRCYSGQARPMTSIPALDGRPDRRRQPDARRPGGGRRATARRSRSPRRARERVARARRVVDDAVGAQAPSSTASTPASATSPTW